MTVYDLFAKNTSRTIYFEKIYLQMMQDIWKEAKFDIPMTPYGCVALGHEVGMIEVVHIPAKLPQKAACPSLLSKTMLQIRVKAEDARTLEY